MRNSVPHAIWKAVAWFRIWRIARHLDSVADRMEKNWREMAEMQFERRGFFSPSEREIRVYSASDLDRDMQALERDFQILAPLFPRTVARMQRSAALSRKAGKNIARLLPPRNEQADNAAREEYRAHQLLDLETLFNEVHGVR